jgi:hypothetical protein
VHNIDCVKPLPGHLLGQYDIVHVQLFHIAVHNNDPKPIVQNLTSLLSNSLFLSLIALIFLPLQFSFTETQ